MRLFGKVCLVAAAGLLSACVGGGASNGAAPAQDTGISGTAAAFVQNCLPLVQTSGDPAAMAAEAGFSRALARPVKRISRNVFLGAPRDVGGLCTLSFGSVWPRNPVLQAAIDAQLAAAGFRPTGQTIATVAGNNPLAGTGAATRNVYSNGSRQVTLEVAGGSTIAPVWGLQALN